MQVNTLNRTTQCKWFGKRLILAPRHIKITLVFAAEADDVYPIFPGIGTIEINILDDRQLKRFPFIEEFQSHDFISIHFRFSL